MNVRTLTESYLEQFYAGLMEDEKSAATIEKYMRDVKGFYVFAGKEKVSKELVVRYKHLLMENYAASSVNSMLVAVNGFLKSLGWHDCVVKALKIQRQRFRAQERELTKAEYYRLLNAAREKKDRRLYMQMQTICSTGIRVSELRFITAEAVQKGRTVVSLKGKTRTVLLPSELCKELKKYARRMGIRKGAIFVTRNGKPMDRSNILHSMKALCARAGVDKRKVFPHNLRHLFACLYYKSVKDLSRLADILGHSSVDTTRIYTSVSGSEQIRQIERLGLVIKKTT